MSNLERAGRKITITLLLGQSALSASVIVAFTVGAIVAVDLAGDNARWTGVPSTLGVIGAAIMAYPMGRLMDRFGRRPGLTAGFGFGVIGMILAGIGVIDRSLPLFLAGFLGLGFARGTVALSRYAAGEANPSHRRARAMGWVVLGGTVGSIAGPSLIAFSSDLSTRMGQSEYAGPLFASAIFFAIGLVLTFIFLRPDPRDIGRELIAMESTDDDVAAVPARSYLEIYRNPHMQLATVTLIFAQVAMVMVMVVTPVHMHGNHHQLSSISLVIMAHTLGMFGLSFVTGWLVDRYGRPRIIAGGGLILAVACLTAPFSDSVLWLSIALFLLGLGWNFCFVAGSALLFDVLRHEERGRIQGLTDTMVNISSGIGNFFSGLAFATFGFAVMSWCTILLGLIPIVIVVFSRPARRRFTLSGTSL